MPLLPAQSQALVDHRHRITADWTDPEGWTDYDPNFANVSLGTGGTEYGRYMRRGRDLFFTAGFVLGTGGSLTGSLTVDLPLGHNSDVGWGPFLAFAYDDTATSTYGQVTLFGGTATFTARPILTETGSAFNGTTPHTWADADRLFISGFYETV